MDAARLVDEKTGRRLAPRDQVQILNALARVAKQENLDLQVVFESDRPLREVDHGGEYNGLKVFYAPDNEQLVAMALKLSRSADGALVSSGVTMESRATEAGIPVLCSSTFRKAFLQGGLPGGGERRDRSNGNGDRDRRRGRDRRRDRNDRGGSGEGNRAPREESQGSGPSESPSASSGTGEAPASPEDNSTVRNLIDLVE
ncbi:MAG TPA: hypothetical protein PKX16_06870 [Kiritimatiellia bacterium]|nr:hypothetical protein [Kiritimatiellia bacterium]